MIVTSLSVVLVLAASSFALIAAFAASPPSTPTITSGPSGNVTAKSATFKYASSTVGVTYRCALDSGALKSCGASGITYTGLGDGLHTFKVDATKSNTTSSAATRVWTVDTTGPTVSVSFPQNLHTYGTGTWNAGCVAGAGICGTATDLTGVALVRVGVLSLNNLRYWNGSSFGSGGQFLLNATGTTSWRLPLPVPPNGTYAVLVSATDTLGNVRSVAQVLLFSTNTTTPPAPLIGTPRPSNPTTATTAIFKFTDSKSGVTFKCSVDSGTATACSSPTTYSAITPGPHCFSVVAVDSFGNSSPPATFCWTITGAPTAAAIAVSSGSPQDTTINSPFSKLVALVTDSANHPVQGVQVTFAAPSSGPSASFAACSGGNPHSYSCVVTTDAAGLATTSIPTANGNAGGYSVTATAAGVVTPATFSLINDKSFGIDGAIPDSSTQGFYPGLMQPLNLSITNPYNFAIDLTGLSISVDSSTTNAGCSGSNLAVTRVFNGSPTVQIAANSTETLAVAGATQAQLPQLTMAHSAPNECQGATFHLTYSGSASHS